SYVYLTTLLTTHIHKENDPEGGRIFIAPGANPGHRNPPPIAVLAKGAANRAYQLPPKPLNGKRRIPAKRNGKTRVPSKRNLFDIQAIRLVAQR
uniref:hypothetical protein n=1 Tax=Lunatimonas salinarum TaxID=1774590 RepID=UPI001AE077AA